MLVVRKLSDKYKVIGVVLGPGNLTDTLYRLHTLLIPNSVSLISEVLDVLNCVPIT